MKRKSPAWTAPIICAKCGNEASRTGPLQKYCRECSLKQVRSRGTKWARENPARPRGPRRDDSALIINRGREINSKIKTPMNDAGYQPGLWWSGKFAVPYTLAASKNHVYSTGSGGHLLRRDNARKFRELVARRAALFKASIVPNKIWVSIFVQKPDHKSDAINVVHSICDALKVGLGLDDRWFCIKNLDWEIVKENPQIFIGVGQETSVPSRVCSSCGRILPITMFGVRSSGTARTCFECGNPKKFAAMEVEAWDDIGDAEPSLL